MFKWLHHLLNPHCSECAHEKVCKNCEAYKEHNAMLIRENERLLSHIIAPKVEVREVERKTPEPVKTTTYVPWNVRQQMLEERDRITAEALRKNNFTPTQPIEQIEENLGVSNG